MNDRNKDNAIPAEKQESDNAYFEALMNAVLQECGNSIDFYTGPITAEEKANLDKLDLADLNIQKDEANINYEDEIRILDGRVLINNVVHLINEEELLNKNLLLAQQAIQYARGHIQSSATAIGLPKKDFDVLSKRVREMRHRELTIDESLRELFGFPTDSSIRAMKRAVRAIKMHAVGNCGEYTQLVLNYLRKQNVYVNVEYFYISNSDHAFAVIGRDPNTDLNNPGSWNRSAVICDAWANKCYPVSEIYKELSCYTCLDFLCDSPDDTPNFAYPFTQDNTLAIDEKLKVGSTDTNYQKNLIEECRVKISSIFDVIKKYLNSDQMKVLQEEFDKIKKGITVMETCLGKMTDTDLERTLNKFIHKALELKNLVPKENEKVVSLDLINSAFTFVKNHMPTSEQEKFVKDILTTMHGKHARYIAKHAKFLQRGLFKATNEPSNKRIFEEGQQKDMPPKKRKIA